MMNTSAKKTIGTNVVKEIAYFATTRGFKNLYQAYEALNLQDFGFEPNPFDPNGTIGEWDAKKNLVYQKPCNAITPAVMAWEKKQMINNSDNIKVPLPPVGPDYYATSYSPSPKVVFHVDGMGSFNMPVDQVEISTWGNSGGASIHVKITPGILSSFLNHFGGPGGFNPPSLSSEKVLLKPGEQLVVVGKGEKKGAEVILDGAYEKIQVKR